MSEATFVQWFCRNINPEFRVNRIENTTSNGYPDVHLEIPLYGDIVIEFKEKNPYLRKEQYAWLTKRWKMDMPAVILLRKNNQIYIWKDRVEVEPLADGKKLKITTQPHESFNTDQITKIELRLCQTILRCSLNREKNRATSLLSLLGSPPNRK